MGLTKQNVKYLYIDIQLPAALACDQICLLPSYVFWCIYNFPDPRLALKPECQQVGNPLQNSSSSISIGRGLGRGLLVRSIIVLSTAQRPPDSFWSLMGTTL